jgi:hypothetical protein
MSMQCQGCSGIYNPTNADGSLYFHVCPTGTPAAKARNENLPSTRENAHGQLIAAGAGAKTATASVVPAGTGV